jgi:hypothetical protein
MEAKKELAGVMEWPNSNRSSPFNPEIQKLMCRGFAAATKLFVDDPLLG